MRPVPVDHLASEIAALARQILPSGVVTHAVRRRGSAHVIVITATVHVEKPAPVKARNRGLPKPGDPPNPARLVELQEDDQLRRKHGLSVQAWARLDAQGRLQKWRKHAADARAARELEKTCRDPIVPFAK